LASLELFCEWVKQKYTRLDVIINNACQTIRRPAQYYSHLMDQERKSMDQLGPKERSLIEANEEFRNKMGVQYLEAPKEASLPGVSCGTSSSKASLMQIDEDEEEIDAGDLPSSAIEPSADAKGSAQAASTRKEGSTKEGVRASAGSSKGEPASSRASNDGASADGKDEAVHAVNGSAHSDSSLGETAPLEARRRTAAEMSQMVVIEEDALKNTEAFPQRADGEAVLDVNDQQLDLRRHNSWVLKLHEVRNLCH
jgi:hypothetical protein